MRVSWLGCVISALVVTMVFGQPAATQTATIPLTSGETLQDVQSILTTLADIGDVRQADTDSAKTAVVVTGTAEQIAFAKWLVGELDKPATAPFPANSAEHEYTMRGTADDLVRVFYLAHCETPRNQQEVMTAIRAVENIRRLFAYPSRRALTVRGTAADIALAEWLVNELDWPINAQSSPPAGPRQYQVPGGNRGGTRLLHTAPPKPPGATIRVLRRPLCHRRQAHVPQQRTQRLGGARNGRSNGSRRAGDQRPAIGLSPPLLSARSYRTFRRVELRAN